MSTRRISERIEELESRMDDVPSPDYVWDTVRDVIDDYDFSDLLSGCADRDDLSSLGYSVDIMQSDIITLETTVEELQDTIKELQDTLATLVGD